MSQIMFRRITSIVRARGPFGTAVLLLDRVTRPFGLSLLSFTRFGSIALESSGESPKERFENIAIGNRWGSSESLSGAGSELERTAGYRQGLAQLLRDRHFNTLFDAPCGDFNWMRLLLENVPIGYVGGDISKSLIACNRQEFPAFEFTEFDITRSAFPETDVWHCRDCFFHLSYSDIELALRNFLGSQIQFALITTHRGLIRNRDIETGGWRYLNLRRAPFEFPRPLETIRDYYVGEQPRLVALWSREQIEEAVGRSSSTRGPLY